MRYLIVLLFIFSTLGLEAQSRDTLVTKKLMFITPKFNPEIFDNQIEWSNKFTDYIEYSRINMGRRMNSSIRHNILAKKQFYIGSGIALASGVFVYRGVTSKQVLYVEYHDKYTKKYSNDAKKDKILNYTVAGILGAGSIYMLFRSSKNYKKSKWYISPDGIRYKFNQ